MVRKKSNYGEITKAIFSYFGDVLAAGYVAAKRGKPDIADWFDLIVEGINALRKQKIKKEKIMRAMRRLERKEIVYLEEVGDKVKVYLKDKDNPRVCEYSIRFLLEFKKKKKKWDGCWFLAFFDVPEVQRNKRVILRKFLKRLGFFPYQKSVYLFPYECEKEVALIKKITQSSQYLSYVIAQKIENEEEALKFFHL